jgi:hypothetical protein
MMRALPLAAMPTGNITKLRALISEVVRKSTLQMFQNQRRAPHGLFRSMCIYYHVGAAEAAEAAGPAHGAGRADRYVGAIDSTAVLRMGPLRTWKL